MAKALPPQVAAAAKTHKTNAFFITVLLFECDGD
jgi:hypothetical protein